MVSLSLSYPFLWPSAAFAQCCKQKSVPSDTVLNPLHSSTPVPQCYLKHSGVLRQTSATGYLLLTLCVCVRVCVRVCVCRISEHSNQLSADKEILGNTMAFSCKCKGTWSEEEEYLPNAEMGACKNVRFCTLIFLVCSVNSLTVDINNPQIIMTNSLSLLLHLLFFHAHVRKGKVMRTIKNIHHVYI